MDIISRLKEFIEANGLSYSQFADTAHIPRPTLSQMINKRSTNGEEGSKKISSEIISKIHSAYPTLNVMWLLFGDGDMETDDNIQFSDPQNDINDHNKKGYTVNNQPFHQNELFNDDFTDFDSENSSHQSSATNSNNRTVVEGDSQPHTTIPSAPPSTCPTKKIRRIVVFYTDSSYQEFRPSDPVEL